MSRDLEPAGAERAHQRLPERSRPILLRLVATLLVVAVLEGLAYAAMALSGGNRVVYTRVQTRLREQTEQLRAILDSQGEALLELDPELGWRYAPGVTRGPYTSGARGARGPRDYPLVPRPGTIRLAAFGDSFVHGNEVSDRQVWSAQLEALRPDTEVLNFGVGGYGADQALLLYRRQRPTLAAHVVVLGLSEMMYARNLSRCRRFLSPRDLPLFKPRFQLDGRSELRLVDHPFPDEAALRRLLDQPDRILESAEGDFFFEPLVWRNALYDWSASVRLFSTLTSKVWHSRVRPDRLYRGDAMNPDSEALPLLVALVSRFADEVEAAGSAFAVVVLPHRRSDLFGSGAPSYAALLDRLDGVRVIDLATSLKAAFARDPDALYAPGGHYSAAGNEVVARRLGRALLDGDAGWGDSRSRRSRRAAGSKRVRGDFPELPREQPPPAPAGAIAQAHPGAEPPDREADEGHCTRRDVRAHGVAVQTVDGNEDAAEAVLSEVAGRTGEELPIDACATPRRGDHRVIEPDLVRGHPKAEATRRVRVVTLAEPDRCDQGTVALDQVRAVAAAEARADPLLGMPEAGQQAHLIRRGPAGALAPCLLDGPGCDF